MKRDKVLHFKDPPGNSRDQIVNAAVLAGYTFFGTLVGIGAAGLLSDLKTGLMGAFISAGFVFFSSLVTQRGLQKE